MTLTDLSTPIRRALIVHAHPEPASFSSAQASAVAQQLRSEGVEVDFIDLYDIGWNPVLSREQFMDSPGYFKPQTEQMRAFADGTLPEPVGAHLAKLQDADLLVLSFPVWWFSMPAILKGWIDQVFLLSAIFGGGYGIFDEGGMTNKKAMMLLTTGGVEASFAPGASSAPGGYGDLNDFLYHVHRGMFEFVGYDVVHPFVTHAPVRLSDEEREQALAKARAYVTETLLAEPAAVR